MLTIVGFWNMIATIYEIQLAYVHRISADVAYHTYVVYVATTIMFDVSQQSTT